MEPFLSKFSGNWLKSCEWSSENGKTPYIDMLSIFWLATHSFVSVHPVENEKIDVLQNMICCISIDAIFDADFENVYFFPLIAEPAERILARRVCHYSYMGKIFSLPFANYYR